MKKGVFWCKSCNVPILSEICSCGQKGFYCGADLKPVFSKERELFESLIGIELPQKLFRDNKRVVLNGKTLFRFRMRENELTIVEDSCLDNLKSNAISSYFDRDFEKRMKRANKPFIIEKEKEAIQFIKDIYKEHATNRRVLISFSGGKDSTITAVLVKKAIGEGELLFSDTTLEFPETIQYVKEFAYNNNFKLNIASPPKTFFHLLDEFGPPSRMMRWCCTTVKAAAINDFYRGIDDKILCYLGIRSKESRARRNYPRFHQNTKIGRQLNAYPILDWLELEIWLYAALYDIEMNPVYDWGHPRIGCWACPNNTIIDGYLTKLSHPALWEKWMNKLNKYAVENGKDKDWVDQGLWKSRRVRYNYQNAALKSNIDTPFCDQRIRSYSFDRPITEELLEFLKPFGKISKKNGISTVQGKEITIQLNLKKNEVWYKCSGAKKLEGYVDKQINKYLNCVKCGGCMGSCKNGAISVNHSFKINEDLCVNCLSCCTLKHIGRSCVALHYKTTREQVGIVA